MDGDVINRDIEVWYWPTASLGDADAGRIDAVLPGDERDRRSRLIHAADRRDFGAAHALLRHTLTRYAPAISPRAWRFEENAFGKPAVVADQAGTPPLTLSLSHTRGVVACVVGRGCELGVDLERFPRGADIAAIAGRYFAASECEQLARCPAEEYPARFAELWTLKESYIKALGLGLSLPLSSFSFFFDGSSRLRFQSHDGSADWHFLLASPSADVRLAVALRPVTAGQPPGVTFNSVGQRTGATTILRRTD